MEPNVTAKQSDNRPWIALTMGDPAGVGPELCLKVIREPRVLELCRPAIFGDRAVLEQVARRLDLPLPEYTFTTDAFADPAARPDAPVVVDLGVMHGEVVPGRPTAEAGVASHRYFTAAIDLAMRGAVAAIATGPITKTTLAMAGIEEPGHTEILASVTGCDNYAMMLYSPRLTVSLVTIHQSLASVSESLRSSEIARIIDLTGRAMRRIRGREPRLAVLGFNPHAGEDGLFGREEIELIAPAIEIARAAGWQIEGPLSPDAAFMPHNVERFDAHVCMYHDQGLIPFKMVSLHDGVNVTLGAPVVRTSVDHGTAYDIAWQGKASITSFIAAIELAVKLASDRPASRAAW